MREIVIAVQYSDRQESMSDGFERNDKVNIVICGIFLFLIMVIYVCNDNRSVHLLVPLFFDHHLLYLLGCKIHRFPTPTNIHHSN